MTLDMLFERRILLAEKLKNCIRDSGYTKASFSKKADISRPTLDRLLNGAVDNKITFEKHLQKILAVLDMSTDELMFYSSASEMRKPGAVYSLNAPMGYVMSKKAEKQYGLLMDVLDLCTIYY